MSNESQIIRTEYSDLMKKSYIDYAMSVIIAEHFRMSVMVSSRFSVVHFMICMSWGSVMISLTGSVPVLSEIPWVNTIRMETVRSMILL